LVHYGTEAYYDHVAYCHPEDEFGGSSGMQIRGDWPHIVALETEPISLHQTVAHELTHAALAHRRLPLWIEEGLAQMAEHDVSGEGVNFDFRRVRKQKDYRRTHSLERFWSGDAFSRSDQSQEFGYQLAEILVRLLLSRRGPSRRRRPGGCGETSRPDAWTNCGQVTGRRKLGAKGHIRE
jgi:hypothetical protein